MEPHHDYEEDSMDGRVDYWPEDSYNDYEEDIDWDDRDIFDDGHDEREDLGWDGGYED